MENSINNNDFISSRADNDIECVMISKSNNIEIMITDEADEVLEKLFIHSKIDIKTFQI